MQFHGKYERGAGILDQLLKKIRNVMDGRVKRSTPDSMLFVDD